MSTGRSLQFDYELRVRDFIEFTHHTFWKAGAVRARYYVMWLALPAGLLAAAVFLWSRFQFDLAAAAAAIGAVLLLLFYPIYYRAGIANYALGFVPDADPNTMLARVTLRLSPQSLVEVMDGVRTEAPWQQVRGVEIAGESTYIYLSGLSAVIVPRRGFDRDDDYSAVQRFAFERLGRPVPGTAHEDSADF